MQMGRPVYSVSSLCRAQRAGGTESWLHTEGRQRWDVQHRVPFTSAHVTQVQILQLLDGSSLAPRKTHKAADTTACFHSVLPALLAMATSPDRAVRFAALASMQAFAASVNPNSSHAEGTLTGMAAPSCPPQKGPTKKTLSTESTSTLTGSEKI